MKISADGLMLESITNDDVNEDGSFTIPDSVTSIDISTFYGCTSLNKITISASVKSIGHGAFYSCTNLTSVIIPDSVKSIGGYTFYDCTSLTTIIIPDSVTSIGNYAFHGCTSLTNITIPNSVTSIGYRAFEGCTSLTNITIPNSVTSISNAAFTYCTILTNITIPNSVTSIGDCAFEGCTRLTNITIPNSVTSIGFRAFYGCASLTNITIPNSVTSIGFRAFRGCTNLTNITIPNSITSIGQHAFYACTTLVNIVIASEDDEVVARIKALLPEKLQAIVAPKEVYITAKAIQNSALAVIENAVLSPELESALPIKALHLLIADYADSEHVTDQVKQAMQAVPIPVTDDAETWITYSASVKAITAQQIQPPQQAAAKGSHCNHSFFPSVSAAYRPGQAEEKQYGEGRPAPSKPQDENDGGNPSSFVLS